MRHQADIRAQLRAGQGPQRTRLRRGGAAGPELATVALPVKGTQNMLGALRAAAEQQVIDLGLQLAERDEDLAAARATNPELMARINTPHSTR